MTNMATPFGAGYRGNVPLIGINGLQKEWLSEKIKLVAVVINDQGLGNERAFAAEGPAVVDVMIDKLNLAPVLFKA